LDQTDDRSKGFSMRLGNYKPYLILGNRQARFLVEPEAGMHTVSLVTYVCAEGDRLPENDGDVLVQLWGGVPLPSSRQRLEATSASRPASPHSGWSVSEGRTLRARGGRVVLVHLTYVAVGPEDWTPPVGWKRPSGRQLQSMIYSQNVIKLRAPSPDDRGGSGE
jgi:hypothetical protein